MGKKNVHKIRELIQEIRQRNDLADSVKEEMNRLQKEIDDHFQTTNSKIGKQPDSDE